MPNNFNLENLFAALSGVSSGGTSSPYTTMSNPSGGMPGGQNMQQNSPMGGTNNFNPQGTWQGNQTQQTGQDGGMAGMTGMFKDIMGRAPAIYQSMQSKPPANPTQGLFNGLSQGMRTARMPYASNNGYRP